MNSVGRCGLTNREAHACVARKIAHRITVACTCFASIAIDTQDSRSLVQPRAFKGVSPAHHASLLHVFVFGLVHQRLTPRGESLAVAGGISPHSSLAPSKGSPRRVTLVAAQNVTFLMAPGALQRFVGNGGHHYERPKS